MPSVNWGTSALSFAGVQRVYIRQRWADAWTLRNDLWCSECVWSLLPAMPNAQLVRYYGRGMPHGTPTVSDTLKIDIRGYCVRIEFDCADGTLAWYGFVDEQVDEKGGVSTVQTGKQTFICYSMAKVLADTFMTYAKWYDEPNTTLRTSGSSIAFNRRGFPNRTDVVKTGVNSHVFYPRMPDNKIQFPKPWDNAAYWSSRDIVSYIEEYLPPTDADGVNLLPIRFDNKAAIPDWDRPTIQTEGRSVLSLLDQLINPARLLQMSVGMDDTTTPDTTVFTIHSLSQAAISLPGVSSSHPANTNQLTIVAAAAQDTNVTVRSSTTRIANQVVVKGAKRETCFTAQIAEGLNTDQALAEGWSTADQNDYEAAASGEVGYGALTRTQKQKLNAVARSKDSLKDVFKTFVIHSDWDRQTVSAPGGDTWIFQEPNPSWDSMDPTSQPYQEYHPFWGSVEIREVLPFKEGYDYTGVIPPDDDDAEVQYRAPYVLFRNPSGANEFLQAEKMSNGIDPTFSVGVGLTKEALGVRLDVLGTWQHSIAYSGFTPLADDDDVGEWDYADGACILTISVQEDRYAEAKYPADADLTGSFDVIRQRILYVGDAYKQTRVMIGTCVDTTTAGDRRNTLNGLTTDGDFMHDDSDELEAIAQIAHAWFGTDRKILTLLSARPSATPNVGQLLTTADGETINTIVSQISISTPLGESGPAGLSYQLQTALGELDALQFIPRIVRNSR